MLKRRLYATRLYFSHVVQYCVVAAVLMVAAPVLIVASPFLSFLAVRDKLRNRDRERRKKPTVSTARCGAWSVSSTWDVVREVPGEEVLWDAAAVAARHGDGESKESDSKPTSPTTTTLVPYTIGGPVSIHKPE